MQKHRSTIQRKPNGDAPESRCKGTQDSLEADGRLSKEGPQPVHFKRPVKASAIHKAKKEYVDDYSSMGIELDGSDYQLRFSAAFRYRSHKDSMTDQRATMTELPFDVTLSTPPSTAGLERQVHHEQLDWRRGRNDFNSQDLVEDEKRAALKDDLSVKWPPRPGEPGFERGWKRRMSTVLKEEDENFAKLLDVGF